MKLLGILVACQNSTDNQVYIPVREYKDDLIPLFERGTTKDIFKFIVRESFTGIQRGKRHQAIHDKYCVYIQGSLNHNVCAYAFTEGEYPSKRVIFQGLQITLDAFFEKLGNGYQSINSDQKISIPVIHQTLKDYSTPEKIDNLTKVLQKVEEIQVILHENVNQFLQAQGDLDILVEKSNDLKMAAKLAFKQSKQINKKQCCNIF